MSPRPGSGWPSPSAVKGMGAVSKDMGLGLGGGNQGGTGQLLHLRASYRG